MLSGLNAKNNSYFYLKIMHFNYLITKNIRGLIIKEEEFLRIIRLKRLYVYELLRSRRVGAISF